MRRRGRGGYRLKLFLGVAIVLVVLWCAGFIVFLQTLPQSVQTDGTRTDAIVVLTGGTLRLDEGLALLEAQSGQKLFISGVHRGVDVAELLRLSQQNPSRAACCIALGHQADDTKGNASETAAWMRAEDYRSVRLVTAGYHMPRSLLEFSAAMPTVTLIAHPVFPAHVKTDQWYIYPGTALLLMGEYTKTVLATLRLWFERALDLSFGQM